MCAEWGLWTEFGPCTAHCGGGLKSRNRQRLCRDDILYTSGEINCVKKTTQFQVCNTQECGKSLCVSSVFFEFSWTGYL